VPELPEAETIARSLRAAVNGRTIVAAAFLSRRVSRDDPARLTGRRIATVRRHGKQILFELDGGAALFIHVKLGMTGALLANATPGAYTRAAFDLDDGTRLLFDDIRQFGSVSLMAAPPRGLGPDPLELTAAEFAGRLRLRRGRLKPLLLNQGFVRGLGNIYSDEALFRAGLHPLGEASRLKASRAAELHGEIVTLLEEAILHRGSSISDYVDATGRRGGFQLLHRVYGKEGEPCPRCGAAIRRIVVAQRGTHFCPHCQRAGR
jgi:formamidopyrimidine-DNA glycosylase